MTNYLTLPFHEQARALRGKKISASELTKAHLERAQARHKEINAYTEIWEDDAMQQAQEADKALAQGDKRPLLGCPIAIKDLIATKQGFTTCGSRMLQGYRSPFDATIIEKLRAAGAVFLGKTNTDEFGMGSSTESSSYGPTRNPWDLKRVPGGSSGGSAAVVADGQAAVALATDTGGSTRQPAAFCGVSGLRPSYGRISRYGLVAYASSLDQIGLLARDARDLALVSEVVFGKDERDSSSVERPAEDLLAETDKDVRGMKIGIPKEYFLDGLDEEIAGRVDEVRKTLEGLGVETIEVSLPHTKYAIPTYYVIAPAEASSNLARYDGIRYGHRAKDVDGLLDLYKKTRSQGFGAEVKRRIMTGTYVLSTGYYEAYYVRALKVRARIAEDFQKVFAAGCDALLCPTTPGTAFCVGEKMDDPLALYLEDVFTVPVNLAGIAGLSIPCGMSKQGLPIGAQLIGRGFGEAALLRLAAAYQRETDWHNKRAFE